MDLPHHVFLAAKTAAHQLPDDAHALLGPAHHACHLLAVLIGDLRADINFHAPVLQRHADTAFRLDKGVVGGGRVEGVLQDHIRLGKALLHVALADLDVLEQISLLVDLRDSLLPRLHGICDDRLWIKFRFDQSRRLLGDLLAFRGNDGYRVSHVSDAFSYPHHHRPVVDDQSMIFFGGNIFGGQHRHNTGQGFGF